MSNASAMAMETETETTVLALANSDHKGILLVNHNLEIVAANDNVMGWLGYRWPEMLKMNITAVFPKLVGLSARLQQLMNAPETHFTIKRVRQMSHDGRPMPTFDMRIEMEMGYMRVILERVYIEEGVVVQKALEHAPRGFSRMSSLFHSTVAAFASRTEQARLEEETYRFESMTDWSEKGAALPLAV